MKKQRIERKVKLKVGKRVREIKESSPKENALDFLKMTAVAVFAITAYYGTGAFVVYNLAN